VSCTIAAPKLLRLAFFLGMHEHPPIYISDLGLHIENLRSNNNNLFTREYQVCLCFKLSGVVLFYYYFKLFILHVKALNNKLLWVVLYFKSTQNNRNKFEKSVHYKKTPEAVRKFTAFSLCQDEVILNLNWQFSLKFC
jgi:hypothetical protein